MLRNIIYKNQLTRGFAGMIAFSLTYLFIRHVVIPDFDLPTINLIAGSIAGMSAMHWMFGDKIFNRE